MKQLFFKTSAILGVTGSLMALGAVPGARAQAQTLFSDDFNSGTLDSGRWSVYDYNHVLHRTRFGLQPTFGSDADGTKFISIPLHTYNADSPSHSTTRGTQILTNEKWGLGGGLEAEAKIRSNNLPPGLVLGFFLYGSVGRYPDTYQQTEIDLELLTKQAGDGLWTNKWDDWNPLRGGPNGGTLTNLPGANWNNGKWHVYKIRWLPGKIEWLVDGRLLLTETRVKPGSPMAVRFNNWMPNPDWEKAAGISAAKTESENQVLAFDVDYVKISRLAPPASGFWGDGSGLKAQYFNSSTLSGTSVERVDPRVSFDWGTYNPVEGLASDGWSARWSGSLQGQYNEKYTISLASDDGARLWINNQLVIDNWDGTVAAENSVTVDLQAGQKVPIKLEYLDKTAEAKLKLSWSSASTTKQAIPQSQLYTTAVVQNGVAAPTFSPPAGTYSSAQTVKLSCTTPRVLIRYTLDGSEPTATSPQYRANTVITVSTSKQIRARAYLTGSPSPTSVANYVISTVTPPTTNAPRVTIDAPANNSVITALSSVSGSAIFPRGPIARVTVRLRRLDTNQYWNGSSWVAQVTDLPTSLSASAQTPGEVLWTGNFPKPITTNFPKGNYRLDATASDNKGNARTSTSLFSK